MSTKSQLTTLIEENLEDASNIPAELHREVENAIVDNLYPSTKRDTPGDTPVVFSSINATISSYRLDTKKQGNIVFISGYVRFNTANVGVFDIFSIIDEEYKPNTSHVYHSACVTSKGYSVPIRMNQGSGSMSIYNDVSRSVPVGENIYINLFYYTE